MPIKHTDKGWYWGSKGPFESKKKAEEVQRAAYSSGYQGASVEKQNVYKPYAIATWRVKTMKKPYKSFKRNTPGRKKRNEIAEAIMREIKNKDPRSFDLKKAFKHGLKISRETNELFPNHKKSKENST